MNLKRDAAIILLKETLEANVPVSTAGELIKVAIRLLEGEDEA